MRSTSAGSRTTPHSPSHSLRGSILIALLIVSTLGVLGTPFVTISLNESRLQWRANDRTQVLAVAEAGVERALWEFNYHNATFAQSSDCTAANVPDACCTAANTGPTCWGPVTGASCPTGTCRHWDYSVASGSGTILGTATIVVKDMTSGTPSIESTATLAGSAASTKVVVQLQKSLGNEFTGALTAITNTPGVHQIILDDTKTVSGGFAPSTVDSYDSTLGAYGGANAGKDTGLSAVGGISISLSGAGTTVHGDALGWNQGAPVVSGITLTGNPRPAGTRSVPDVPLPSPCTPPALPAGCSLSGGMLVVSVGSTCMLGSGTYCFPGGITVQGRLATTGEARVHTPGWVFVGSALTDLPARIDPYQGKPQNFQVYSVLDGLPQHTFYFSHSVVSGLFYQVRPTTNGTFFSETDFYGSLVAGGNIDVHASTIHFDDSIRTLTSLPAPLLSGPVAKFVVSSWQRDP